MKQMIHAVPLVLLAAMLVAPNTDAGPIGGIQPPPPTCRGVDPGDVNDDGAINVSDLVMLSGYLCSNQPTELPKPANADVNADCELDLDDVIYLRDYIFGGGPAPLPCVCGDPATIGCVNSCDYVVPADVNQDGNIDIGDVTALINMLCHDGAEPLPLGNADVNGDCEIDLDDVIYLRDYIFGGGLPPVACSCGTPPIVGCVYSCEYVEPGDVHVDGAVDISDVTALINMLCHDGAEPVPLGNADVNGDAIVNLDDVIHLTRYIFEGGPAPQPCVVGSPEVIGCEATCLYVVPGDANGDDALDISDVVFLIDFLCHEGAAPFPLGNGDVDGDCVIDMDDIDHLVAYIFEGGPPPAPCACGDPDIGTCDEQLRELDLASLAAGADKATDELPRQIELAQNRPNPFNPSTQIQFGLHEPARVRLEIFTAAGARVRTLADGAYQPGVHTLTWDGRDDTGAPVGAGVYLYTLTAGAETRSRKMVLVK